MSFISAAIQLNNSAVNLCNCDRYGEALVLFNDALRAMQASQRDPYDRSVNLDKAGVIDELDRKTSQLCFSEPLVIERDEVFVEETMCAVVMYNVGLVYIHEGSLDRACKLFEISLGLLPENICEGSLEAVICTSTHRHLGLIRYYEGRLEEAVNLLTDAYLVGREAFGDHEMVEGILNTLAQVFIRRGSMSEAGYVIDELSRLSNHLLVEKANRLISVEDNVDSAAAAA